MKLHCELIINSDVEHLQQIYTGFSLLHRKGFLQLKQTIPNEFLGNKNAPDRWVNYNFFNVKVILNGQITVCYDTHDWNWIDEEILGEADFYFKRSFDINFLSDIKDKSKIYPLGLNYQVTSPGTDLFKLERAAFYGGKEKIKTIVKGLRIDRFFGGRGEAERLDKLEAYPDFRLEPKILFMTRVWDTSRIESKQQKEAVEVINETRADYVRRLRKEFGERFFGGLAHEDYALKHFNDCLLPDNSLSDKRKYLEILQNFPICVATTGLNNSAGWKLGEYVAFSKAIITEPLHYQVPGNFVEKANYLEFTKPDELINVAARLFEDKNLRSEIMMNNFRYYRAFVRPEALILNSLAVVFSNGNLF